MPNVTEINSTLIANNNVAAYEMDFLNNSNFVRESDGEQGTILAIRPTKNPIIFKDLKTDKVFNKENIMSKFYLIEDDLSVMFNWTLSQNYKEILGYKCQEATTHYRGRDYKAYFTTEIPFSTGPWKFGGLPGLILKTESLDGVFKIVANKIELKNSQSTIENPFESTQNEAISWDEFIEIYQNKYLDLQNYRSPAGGSMSIPTKNIETYIKE
ncbi:conserved hypothetical protein [Formosa agariphila KMM 3901]|uniref:GLPGLI family protein n=2 Tax=Formosa TaxID=225842 RepID=T2KRM7_FORAG|nr:conserved hypothetical protein [Formosa agariphila KMM 3901]